MENLFLYYYENKLLFDAKKRNLCRAHLFDNTFHLEFDRNFKNGYPSELQLKKENISAS